MSSCQLCGKKASLGVDVPGFDSRRSPASTKVLTFAPFLWRVCEDKFLMRLGPVTFTGLLEALERDVYNDCEALRAIIRGCEMSTLPFQPISQSFAESGGGRSAGSGSWTAPSRDLDGSLPSATAGGDCSTLEWATYPPQPVRIKSCPDGSEAELPMDRAFRACLPSLDNLKNNRHSDELPIWARRPIGRGKWCGRWSMRGASPVRRPPCMWLNWQVLVR